jgi:hypothetical protein
MRGEVVIFLAYMQKCQHVSVLRCDQTSSSISSLIHIVYSPVRDLERA